MRFIVMYLCAYFGVIAALGLVLWQAGILVNLPQSWVVTGGLVAVALGLLLAVASLPQRVRRT